MPRLLADQGNKRGAELNPVVAGIRGEEGIVVAARAVQFGLDRKLDQLGGQLLEP